MEIIADTTEFHIDEPTSVAIGKFDGRHKGHQKLLREMISLRDEYGYRPAVFTFDMQPMEVLGHKPQAVISTNDERRRNMEEMGVDYLVEYPFDEKVAHISAEEFVERILLGQMNAKAIVAGTDCTFGYKAAGNADLLKELAPRMGFKAVILEKEQDKGRDISSTYIREELEKGNIEKANALLGEPYSISGCVVHGHNIGGPRLGFPTANIVPPAKKQLPPFGVYATRVRFDGKFYDAVTNVGRKPTVEDDAPVGVETYLFKPMSSEELYGKNIEVLFYSFLRDEKKFPSLEELKTQIERDKQDAARVLGGID